MTKGGGGGGGEAKTLFLRMGVSYKSKRWEKSKGMLVRPKVTVKAVNTRTGQVDRRGLS